MTDVSIDPRRKPTPFRPIKAMKHMRNLIADKEDTAQVFDIIESLNGNSLRKNFDAFVNSEEGAARLSERQYLPPLLDEREWMHDLPDGSVGRTYVEFMEREGLTAQGLVDESELRQSSLDEYDDDLKWYGKRLRDTHDMFHILSGYGRDALGEASLLAFSHGQNPGRGLIFISYMGCREIARSTPKELRIWDCYKEGKRNGKLADKIARQDILSLLPEPIDVVRKRMNIQPPVAYQRALRLYDEMGHSAQELVAAA